MALRQRYVDAVCKEIVLRGTRREARDEKLETIYLGGGTPSQLTIEQLKQLFLIIDKVYGVEQVKEVTIECNPDDVTEEYAAALPQLGINRVSMGVQTFDNQRLNFLRRRHTAEQIPVAIQHLRNAGFHNISIDLMYGFPGETLDDWRRDIEAALTLNVEHLSAYCLMVEEGTALYKQMRNEKKEVRNDSTEELERQMYELLIDRLTTAGYEHYEISNFARPGFRSHHNSSYWQDVPYVGIGAAAHSYDGHQRSWNVSDISQYIKGIENGQPAFESEVLDDDTRYNDRITVALRTREGLRLDELSEQQRNYLLRSARRYVDDGLLQLTGTHIRLTRRGLFVSDMVMSDLMLV